MRKLDQRKADHALTRVNSARQCRAHKANSPAPGRTQGWCRKQRSFTPFSVRQF
jgi:hypothetical protein